VRNRRVALRCAPSVKVGFSGRQCRRWVGTVSSQPRREADLQRVGLGAPNGSCQSRPGIHTAGQERKCASGCIPAAQCFGSPVQLGRARSTRRELGSNGSPADCRSRRHRSCPFEMGR
jgi:hypothetical protein